MTLLEWLRSKGHKPIAYVSLSDLIVNTDLPRADEFLDWMIQSCGSEDDEELQQIGQEKYDGRVLDLGHDCYYLEDQTEMKTSMLEDHIDELSRRKEEHGQSGRPDA